MAPQVGLEPTTLRLTVGGSHFLPTTTHICAHCRISNCGLSRLCMSTADFCHFLLRVPGKVPRGHRYEQSISELEYNYTFGEKDSSLEKLSTYGNPQRPA